MRRMRRMGRLAASLALALLGASAGSARAQDPGRLEGAAERASALWPIARGAYAVTWDGERWADGRHAMAGLQLVTHAIDLSIPIGALTLELNVTGQVRWLTPDRQDQIVFVTTGNPEITAWFTDRPVPEVRYQLGGAVALPLETTTVVDGINPPGMVIPLFPTLPISRLRSLGWNVHRVLPAAATLVARGRLEVAPHPALLLALALDVPVTITFAGEVAVRPQGELTVAARIDDLHLLGVRTEVVSFIPRSPQEVNVLVEPFARVAWTISRERVLGYARAGVRLPLGPAFPFVTESPTGWIGGNVEAGLVY